MGRSRTRDLTVGNAAAHPAFIASAAHRHSAKELLTPKSTKTLTGVICLAAAMSVAMPALAQETTPPAPAETPTTTEQPAWKPWRMRIEFWEGRYLRSRVRYATREACETALEQEIVNFVALRRSTRAGRCVADGIEA